LQHYCTNGRGKWKGEKVRNLSVGTALKTTIGYKTIVINKQVYQFHLRTNKLPYRLQNSWEEILDVSIPWHMVYELIHKTTPDSKFLQPIYEG
jgi:hypothetical protein